MKAGELVYLASKETVKMVVLSWVVAIIMTAESVAAKAKNLSRRWHNHLVLAMDFTRKRKVGELNLKGWFKLIDEHHEV